MKFCLGLILGMDYSEEMNARLLHDETPWQLCKCDVDR